MVGKASGSTESECWSKENASSIYGRSSECSSGKASDGEFTRGVVWVGIVSEDSERDSDISHGSIEVVICYWCIIDTVYDK